MVPLQVEHRRARVLVLLNDLALGGAQLNAVDLAHSVLRFGYESLLVAEEDPGQSEAPILQVAAQRGLHVRLIKRQPHRRALARTLRSIALEHRVDLVHVYGWWRATAAFWGPCRLGRVPLVTTAYEMAVPENLYPTSNLIVGTGYLLDYLKDRKGPTYLVSPPVDTTRDATSAVDHHGLLEALGMQRTNLRLVIVSRLAEEMKAAGIEYAMRAVGLLKNPRVDLLVVGTGDAEPRLRAVSREVNAELGRPAITMPGAMIDPRPAYACADIVLGMGSSAARGLAFSKPLVVLGEHGFCRTFEPVNANPLFRSSFWSDDRCAEPVELLAQELRPLLADVLRRRDLGDFGRGFAEEHFGLDAMTARLAEVYDVALDRGYPRRNWLADSLTDLGAAVSFLGLRAAGRFRRGAG